MIWSIIPNEFIFRELDDKPPQVEKQTLHIQGVTMIVEVTGFGEARIERLLSPYPRDYLKPEWMPGQMIRLFP